MALILLTEPSLVSIKFMFSFINCTDVTMPTFVKVYNSHYFMIQSMITQVLYQ